jgi:hypothetical protein
MRVAPFDRALASIVIREVANLSEPQTTWRVPRIQSQSAVSHCDVIARQIACYPITKVSIATTARAIAHA